MSMEESPINLPRDYRPLSAARFFAFLTHWSKTNLLIEAELPAKDSKVGVEVSHEHRAPPKEAAEDEDRKELRVGLELFSSGKIFFSLHCSVRGVGRTLTVRGG